MVFTPSRQVGGRRLICYDDRYILRLAAETDGIVVSNDNYRDLVSENPEYRKIVEERILMYSFVNNRFVSSNRISTHNDTILVDVAIKKTQQKNKTKDIRRVSSITAGSSPRLIDLI